MNRSSRRILLLGLALTAAFVAVATATDTARIGPLVVWTVHRTTDADGSTVALRPGLGLLALWVVVIAAAVLLSRRHDV